MPAGFETIYGINCVIELLSKKALSYPYCVQQKGKKLKLLMI